MTAKAVGAGAGPLVLVGCADGSRASGLTGQLESLHFTVEVAACGGQAMERLEAAEPPAIALLDMDLRSPGGVEIVRVVGRRPERPRTWLILMVERTGQEAIRAALEAGCDDLLTIPPDAMELETRMHVAERARGLLRQVRRQTAELEFQATHDALTGLWNREVLLSLIFQETDRVQRMKTGLCLMLMDLDEFSRINHAYGYQAGDQVLTALANRFRRQLRSYDLIGRCGEDEFLLALPGCRGEDAGVLAERIRTIVLQRPFAVGNEATTLTASFGVACSRGRSPLVVLGEAERALSEAKLAGKNCVRCAVAAEAGRVEVRVLEASGAEAG
jgi:two-component system, cell cycle response regulator